MVCGFVGEELLMFLVSRVRFVVWFDSCWCSRFERDLLFERLETARCVLFLASCYLGSLVMILFCVMVDVLLLSCSYGCCFRESLLLNNSYGGAAGLREGGLARYEFVVVLLLGWSQVRPRSLDASWVSFAVNQISVKVRLGCEFSISAGS
ncbi:hypothetical protein Droror1_Dr00024331 [Drosera rotundifolia]